MKVPLAWRMLTADRRRTALALAGTFMAILLVFIELGLFYAVPQGGQLLYDNMGFDLLLVSDRYEYQAQTGTFPASRIERVRRAAEVASAAPIYFGFAKWQSGEAGVWPDVFVIGFDPAIPVFTPGSIDRQLAALEPPDTVLVDSATRPMFGPLDPGRRVTIDDRPMTIAGRYDLGTGFMGLGVVLTSAQNFAALFPQRGLAAVNLAAIRLKPGVDAGRAAVDLQGAAGGGTRVFTREALAAHEAAYWTTRTSVGIIFGSGLLISFVVGIMILYQIVSAQIGRQLPQFATLKAIGYADSSLVGTVAAMSLLIVGAGFVLALGAGIGLSAVIRQETLLPVTMTPARILAVFGAAVAMGAASALLAVWGLRRAAPADVF